MQVSRAVCGTRIRVPMVSAAALALAMSTGAHAQTAPDKAGPPARAAGEQTSIPDIIVTAQRRDEALEDVPATVTYVSAAALTNSGIVGVSDLARVVPGLQVSTSGAFTQPTIRGVGSYLTGTGLENNVAIYIDGVYLPATVTNALDFVDIENVQVLKGPQGTLYGRNATGGAIIVTTRDPSFKPYLDLKASYSSFNEVRLSAVAATGLTDTIAVGIAAQYRSSDGYIKNIITGRDEAPVKRLTIRPKLEFRPNDNLTINLGLEYSRVDDSGGLAWQAYKGDTVAAGIPGAIIATAPYTLSNGDPNQVKADTYSATLRGDLTLKDIKISSATFYRDSTQNLKTDMDGSQLTIIAFNPWTQLQKTFSQDLIVSKSSGMLEWLIGGLYYYDDSYLKTFTLVGAGNLYSPTQKTEALAGYFDLTLHATDRLTLEAGGRYSTEEKHYINRASPGGPPTLDARARFNAFTPKVSIRYEVSDRANVYASYGQGFKSGLFNAGGGGATPINPENIDAYEIGFKLGGHVLSFDTAAFLYNYSDLQTTIYDFTGGGVQSVINAGKARIKGIEASVSYRPTNRLTLSAAGTYLDAKYTDFPNAQDYCPAVSSGALPVPGSTACPTGTPVGGNVATSVNAAGQPLLRAPEFSGNVTASYTVPIASGDLLASGNLYYSSKYNYSPNGRLFQPAYVLGSVNLTYTDRSGWSVGAYADNIFDEVVFSGLFSWQVSDLASYRPPRTFGVRLGYKLP